MKLIEHTPQALAHARHLYEDTGMPVADVAKYLEISQTTFYKRNKEWGWRPRNRRLAELDDAAKANVPLEKIREIAAPATKVVEKISLLARVRSAVENEIIKIDDVLQRVEGVHLRSSDAERAARTLATLGAHVEGTHRARKTGRKNGRGSRDANRVTNSVTSTNSVASLRNALIACAQAGKLDEAAEIVFPHREKLERDWPFWARAHQLPPPQNWKTWLILGGRGAGKTRAGADGCGVSRLD